MDMLFVKTVQLHKGPVGLMGLLILDAGQAGVGISAFCSVDNDKFYSRWEAESILDTLKYI